MKFIGHRCVSTITTFDHGLVKGRVYYIREFFSPCKLLMTSPVENEDPLRSRWRRCLGCIPSDQVEEWVSTIAKKRGTNKSHPGVWGGVERGDKGHCVLALNHYWLTPKTKSERRREISRMLAGIKRADKFKQVRELRKNRTKTKAANSAL